MMEWPSDNELVGDAIRYLGRHIAVSAHEFAESIIKEQAARRSAGHPYHPYPEKPFVQVEAPGGSCVCEKCAPVYIDGPNRAEAIRRGRERLEALAGGGVHPCLRSPS